MLSCLKLITFFLDGMADLTILKISSMSVQRVIRSLKIFMTSDFLQLWGPPIPMRQWNSLPVE